MVFGTFTTNYIRENFRNFFHLWPREETRFWFYGLGFSFVLLSHVSRVRNNENHESRVQSSHFYKMNLSELADDPLYRLPVYPDGSHNVPGRPKAHAGH